MFFDAGRKFGKLTVVRFVEIKKTSKGRNRHIYECLCECGNISHVEKNSLIKGDTKSCGCIQKETISKIATTHGLRYTTFWYILNNIKQRCLNKNNPNYKWYGGVGITICDEWLDKDLGLINFKEWCLDNGYRKGLTIDRINVYGNYCPENCRFATRKEQAQNKRSNIKYQGLTIAQWAEKFNMKYNTLQSRIKRGVPIDVVVEKEKLKHGY